MLKARELGNEMKANKTQYCPQQLVHLLYLKQSRGKPQRRSGTTYRRWSCPGGNNFKRKQIYLHKSDQQILLFPYLV